MKVFYRKLSKAFHSLPFPLDFSIGCLIFIVGYNLFFYRIDAVRWPYGDENLYTSAAQAILDKTFNENWSHPPLGKWIIAQGIRAFGDGPLGWRITSVLSGSLTLSLMYWIGLILFKNRYFALLVSFLCAFNQILFVESRMAGLDIHMFAIVSFGLVFFARYWFSQKAEWNLWVGFSFFGMAIAIKWFAMVPMLLSLFLLFYGQTRNKKNAKDHFRTGLRIFLKLGGLSLLMYFLFFWTAFDLRHPAYAPPLLGGGHKYKLFEMMVVQVNMLLAQLSYKADTLMYQTRWYSWPTLREITWLHRPYIWTEGKFEMRGLGLIGNHLIMWGGLPAVGLCLRAWVKKQSRPGLFIATFYLGMYLFWAVVPRTVTFYQYYFPAAMMLSFAIVFAFQSLQVSKVLQGAFCGGVLVVFLFSYPFIANQFLSETEFHQRYSILTLGAESHPPLPIFSEQKD